MEKYNEVQQEILKLKKRIDGLKTGGYDAGYEEALLQEIEETLP